MKMNAGRAWNRLWFGRCCRPVEGLVFVAMLAALVYATVPARADSGAARRAAVLSSLATMGRAMSDYLLSVSVSGPGMGTVTSGDGLIDCGFDCSEFYFEDDVVTLTATAATGSYFAGWDLGPCTGEDGDCVVTIQTQPVFVGAVFELNPRLELQVFGTGEGFVEADIAGDSGFPIFCSQLASPCEDTFPRDTSVVLTPAPQPGSFFVGWASGPCMGQTGPCTITLPSQTGTISVAANFGRNPQLEVFVIGGGLGSVAADVAGDNGATLNCDSFGSNCDDTFPPGTTVVLTPTAQSGSHFFGWTSGPCLGQDGPCTVTLPDDEGFLVVEARFDRNPEVELRISGTGSGSVSSDIASDGGSPLECNDVTEPCFGTFPPDSSIQFTAVAGANSFFEGWLQGPCGLTSTCEVLLFPPMGTTTLEASFRGNSPPTAVCQPVVINASSECISLDAPAAAFDGGSTDPDTDFGDVLSFSVSPQGPYPIGITAVTLTVTDVHGATDTCDTTIEIIAIDCNSNGVPDTCDIETGFSLDCNNNWVPDECECYWCNAIPTFTALPVQPGVNAQVSHLGGGTECGEKVADDFYLEPGCAHRITAVRARMLTTSYSELLRARLELYEDCNGVPADEPFFTADYRQDDPIPSEVLSIQLGPDGESTLVTYRFDLCDACLWLEGGKTYWVSVIGLPDNINDDLSYWLADQADGLIKGKVPVKRSGTPGATWQSCDFGPWMSLDECCLGCVNMDFCIDGYRCPILWENGKPDLGAGRGGSPSGAHQAGETRTADSFVIKPECPDIFSAGGAPGLCIGGEDICLIEAWIWSNCEPVHGFIELYRDLPCGPPELENTPFVVYSGEQVEATRFEETWMANGQTHHLWRLRVKEPNLTLCYGTNYWISAGGYSTGSFVVNSYFANAAPKCNPCTTPHTWQITPGQYRSIRALSTEWADVNPKRDFAFRIAKRDPREIPTDFDNPNGMGNPNLPDGTPACIADANHDGQVAVDDIFAFLAAWFTGCP